MTNADVPALAVTDVIENPLNPYTGKDLRDTSAKDDPLYIFWSYEYGIYTNNGKQFIAGPWYRLSGQDVRLKENWEKVAEEEIYPVPGEGAD